MVELYWKLGEYLSHRVAEGGWGRGTAERLAAWLSSREPGLRGFSASNLWRMRQFYETYAADPILAPLVRELPWASNLLVLGRCKRADERGFYLRLAVEQRWPKRELSLCSRAPMLADRLRRDGRDGADRPGGRARSAMSNSTGAVGVAKTARDERGAAVVLKCKEGPRLAL